MIITNSGEMKLREVATTKNVKSFLQAHKNMFLDKFSWFPKHKKEQVMYRLVVCKDDCVPQGKCIRCGCPPEKKAFAELSCNLERFPNMMDLDEWEEFKMEHDIDTSKEQQND